MASSGTGSAFAAVDAASRGTGALVRVVFGGIGKETFLQLWLTVRKNGSTFRQTAGNIGGDEVGF